MPQLRRFTSASTLGSAAAQPASHPSTRQLPTRSPRSRQRSRVAPQTESALMCARNRLDQGGRRRSSTATSMQLVDDDERPRKCRPQLRIRRLGVRIPPSALLKPQVTGLHLCRGAARTRFDLGFGHILATPRSAWPPRPAVAPRCPSRRSRGGRRGPW